MFGLCKYNDLCAHVWQLTRDGIRVILRLQWPYLSLPIIWLCDRVVLCIQLSWCQSSCSDTFVLVAYECVTKVAPLEYLMPWGLNKVADMLQTIFWNRFSWKTGCLKRGGNTTPQLLSTCCDDMIIVHLQVDIADTSKLIIGSMAVGQSYDRPNHSVLNNYITINYIRSSLISFLRLYM